VEKPAPTPKPEKVAEDPYLPQDSVKITRYRSLVLRMSAAREWRQSDFTSHQPCQVLLKSAILQEYVVNKQSHSSPKSEPTMMAKDQLLQAVLSSDELPTLPTVASKLISLTSREDATLGDISELIAKDMSISAKILKVSNSAFYSFPQQIGSINQAVSILGMNAVRSLVLSFSFLTMKGGKTVNRFDFEGFWERSLASAVAAKLILEKVQGANTEEIFISGLLQNLGELILARTFAAEYDQVLTAVEDNQYDRFAAEEAIFGVNHAVVGAEVAKKWGFPEVLQLPILYHHNPDAYQGRDKSLQATIKAVYLSNLLVNILYTDVPETYHKQFRREAAKLLGLGAEAIESILEQVHLKIKEAGTYFNLKMPASKSVQEILQEANIRLSLINLDYDQMNKQLVQAKMHLEKLTRELEEKNRILDNLANLDGLTGVYNHRYFQNTLDQEISRASRHGLTISLLLIDIDHFKKFNDNFGHQAGDFVLTKFARLIRDNIRNYDTVARYGGEEFVVILPETTAEDALVVAEKLRLLITDTPLQDNHEEYRVTASFGHASTTPGTEDGFTKNGFICKADEALYDAKEKGRNRVCSYVPKKKWFAF
jgi:two-component system, cell cycle response regulator